MMAGSPPASARTPTPTILITNPGAELYGADRMVLETVSGLAAPDSRVLVALPHDGPLADRIEQRGGLSVVVPMAVLRKNALRPKGLLRLIKDALTSIGPTVRLLRRERPVVIIVNTIVSPLWLLAAKMTRTPVISHVHEAETSGSAIVRRALTLPQLLADLLIVNSEFSRRVVINSWPRIARRSRVIYNAVPGPETVVPPRDRLSGPVRLLYVGRLSPRKGPDVAVDALARLVERGIDAELDLVGEVFRGYEWFSEQLRSQVAEQGLRGRVHFHGFCDNVWAFAERADISLIPSVADEPFGNTAVEAALAARPLIVSATSGLIEATRDLKACIGVPRSSPDAIADAVQSVMDDWDEFAARAAQDATATAERYSTARYAAEVTRAVATVTGNARRPATSALQQHRSA